MPENPIAQGEIDALTRRVEAVEDRVESLQVQTGGNFAAVIEGQAALRREVRQGFTDLNKRVADVDKHLVDVDKRLDGVNKRVGDVDERVDGVSTQLDGFITEQRAANASILAILAALSTKDTD